MTVAVFIKRCVFLGFLLGLLSCGGEGGGIGGSGIQPVVAVGAVTARGSIEVNGVLFDISDATIIFNGEPGSEDDLQVGHVVTVQGTLDPSGTTGIADTVVFDSNAEGPIDSIGPAPNSLVVLGQLVLVNDMTQFGDIRSGDMIMLSDLDVGNIVELSGFPDANGVLRATRIDRTQDAFVPGFAIETTGTVANFDGMNQTFNLHMLQVNFSDDTELINLP